MRGGDKAATAGPFEVARLTLVDGVRLGGPTYDPGPVDGVRLVADGDLLAGECA